MTDALEVRLLRWGESSHAGRTVTFLLPDEGDHPFRGLRTGKDGELFALAVARIDDPQAKANHIFPGGYVDAPKEKAEKSPGQKAVALAHILTNSHDFQRWACGRWPSKSENESLMDIRAWTRWKIIDHCGVKSRGDFAVNPYACERLHDLKVQFDHRDTRR